MKKRILDCILVLVLAISLVPAAFAASDEANTAAKALYDLGLFQGVGKDANGNPNFDLDRTPSRNEAVTMLVRLLGKEQEAKDGTWNIPFTDVADWAELYVGYAYTNGLTAGTSTTTYSGNDPVTASQYLTFVLRALGYTSGTDFEWNAAWELSDKIGLTDGRYNASTTNFTRGDVAIISNNALGVKYKDKNITLKEGLPDTPTTGEQTEDAKNMGKFALEEIYCDRTGESRVVLQGAIAKEWKTCCSDILITDYNDTNCFIYVMSTASTRKHHYIECTDTNGYKYICFVVVF